MRLIIYGLLLICLIIMSIQDIKEKKVSAIYLIIVSVLAAGNVIYVLITAETDIYHWLPGIMPGLIICGIKVVARGAIGLADCVIVLLLGAFLEISELIVALLIMMIVMTIVSLFAVVVKKADKKTTIPMIPFITAGVIGGIISDFL